MNRTQLKYIAITAMLLDHIGMLFGGFFMSSAWGMALYVTLRVLGRLTAPIMCFFLTEGYIYTRSRKKYALRLAIFAVISQIPYALAHKNSLLTPDFNMLFVLLISFAILCVLDCKLKGYFKFFIILVLFALSCYCDWGFFGPLMVICFYKFREKPLWLVLVYCLIVILMNALSCLFLPAKGIEWYSELWQLGLFLFVPVLYLYNGEPGSRAPFHKWFFYVFYPLHLLMLWLLYSLI
ncbi:MAG: hypothetical protein IK102_09750 [Treponema sp.]|nr:hypothetical protein [Treponema sp.]